MFNKNRKKLNKKFDKEKWPFEKKMMRFVQDELIFNL